MKLYPTIDPTVLKSVPGETLISGTQNLTILIKNQIKKRNPTSEWFGEMQNKDRAK
jgi:hypothetical protein